MKTLVRLLLLGLALAAPAMAQELPEALTQNFYSPELVHMAQPALNLSEEQKTSLQEALERIQPGLAQTSRLLEKENGLLLTLVKQDKLDPDAVLLQADKVMHLEQENRRASLALLLRIREILTPAQQATLKDFKTKRAAVQARVRQAMDLAQKWKQEGRDLSTFEQAQAQFESLMNSGNFNAAEALLDKTLQALKQPPTEPKK